MTAILGGSNDITKSRTIFVVTVSFAYLQPTSEISHLIQLSHFRAQIALEHQL